MDISSCVARRTRSKTESYLVSILNQTKGTSLTPRKSRASMRNTCSSSPKRPKRLRTEDDDDVEFLGTTQAPEGNQEKELVVENDDSVRVCDLRGDEEITIMPLSDTDEIMSLSSSDSDEYRDYSDNDDYVEESSEESSDEESSESEFEEGGDKDVRNVNERRKPLRREYRESNLGVFDLLAKSTWEKTKIFEEDSCSGDEAPLVDCGEVDVVRESASDKVHSWSGNAAPVVDCGEGAMVGESASDKVRQERKPRNRHNESDVVDCGQGANFGESARKPRNRPRVKGNNESHVFDLLQDEVGSFDGGPTEDSPLINLRFGIEEEPEPIERTEEEKEIDRLWEDMALALKLEGLNSSTPAKGGDVPCFGEKHDFVLDEEIGLKCRHCSYVVVEIKDVSPAMGHYYGDASDKRKCSDRKGDSLSSRLDFGASDHSSYATSSNDTEGTVWQYIPGVKDTMYPHQQEGFEFIWKNLAGTTKLDELESLEVKKTGGCIISHAPGTGKTRLTISFLRSYLERFPDSHPVVIAPACLLLTWEEEFKKWNANIPFYNMGTLDFSGLEDQSAVSLLKENKSYKKDVRSIRIVKLYSWRKKKSVLGISYDLFVQLANKDAGEVEFRRMLIELPGLLVLDEGHTPRNQKSYIWKVLRDVKTEKRIILSGTPFQNNFKELSNVLCLARPACKDLISSRLQDLSKWSKERKNGGFCEEIDIRNFRTMIAPFVHVYKGNILRESLPGLRDCVVVLKPTHAQKKILTRIERRQKTFELEHKLCAVSVHPSLFMACKPTKIEKILIGDAVLKNLESLRLKPEEGVKTRFLIDFIRFCETVKEKVLVFSQYTSTLKLIRDQLSAVFGWEKGQEILFMNGQVDQRDRQHIINDFNKPDSESKVLLASTKACSEGINLIGASRVILLDVVWNPSVERQAISRAYRIGQKRVVYTYHLMTTGTTEWDKYCKQNEKHQISEMVFSSTSENDVVINKEVVSEDRILDEMVGHVKLKDMFEKILNRPKESDRLTNIL